MAEIITYMVIFVKKKVKSGSRGDAEKKKREMVRTKTRRCLF